jgi:hypothetical protein
VVPWKYRTTTWPRAPDDPQNNQPMLLTAHTDTAHLLFPVPQLIQHAANGRAGRFRPCVRMLLQMTDGQARDQFVALLRLGKNFAGFHIESDGLGALGATIDS